METTATTHSSKKIIIFDLDGTLAASKQPLDDEMADLIRQLLHSYKVGVISGGFFPQFEKQFLASLNASSSEMKELILLPTSGASMYRYEGDTWKEIYCDEIEPAERKRIISILEEAIDYLKLRPESAYGELIEDRRSQITYSGLGQAAPIDAKAEWDPRREKRLQVVDYITPKLEGYSIRIGGMTSIDITKPGIDKAYGIRRIEKELDINIDEMIFVGDALGEGGNDAPARGTGVECVEVTGPQDTKRYIRNLL